MYRKERKKDLQEVKYTYKYNLEYITIYLIIRHNHQNVKLGKVMSPESVNSYSASHDNWCTVGGDGRCRVGEVRAGTTSPMPDHKGFKLQ